MCTDNANEWGSGTTGVACMNTGRRFIGMEKDVGYFEIARQRILAAMPKPANDNEPAQLDLLATVA